MTAEPISRAALIGLGNMGLPLAIGVAASAAALRVYDPQAAAQERALLAGLDVATTLREAVVGAEVVLLVLPNSTIVANVVDELLEALAPGVVIVDMSSSDPQDTLSLAGRVLERKVRLVDAPVSGGVARAVERTLAIMVGGSDEDVELVEPLLRAVGDPRHVGPLASGHAMKALNNLVSAAHLAATSRAVLAAEHWGVTREVAVATLDASSGQSVSSSLKWPRYVLTGRYDAGFAAALMEKDVRIAVSALRAASQDSPLASAVLDEWSAAAAWLEPATDHTAIVRWIEAGSPVESASG